MPIPANIKHEVVTRDPVGEPMAVKRGHLSAASSGQIEKLKFPSLNYVTFTAMTGFSTFETGSRYLKKPIEVFARLALLNERHFESIASLRTSLRLLVLVIPLYH